jgi:hypothetical protein
VGTITAPALVTIYYRTEGGSVVGALPIATGKQINRMNLTGCTASPCNITGSSAANGVSDSFGNQVVKDTVQLGVTDVEPAQLTGADYPTAYQTAVFGSATGAQMAALATVPAIQQVFGLAVNTSGMGGITQVNLTKESAANILTRFYTDWHSVPDAFTGNPVTAAATPITRVDREPGSGTRTQANIFFLQYQCGSTTAITDTVGEVDFFSTGNDLTQANSVAGSITYTVINQLITPSNRTKFPNLVLATINGVTPSTLAAATGEYDDWFEATLVPNPLVTTGPSAILSNALQGLLPALASAPLDPSVNVIPNVGGNVATVPLTVKTGTANVYVNPYTRNGNSCSVPQEQN